MAQRRAISGGWGEQTAAAHAARRGARVLARNVRIGRGELDLVLDDGGVLAFVEVKTRRRWALTSGLGAVGRRKRRAIVSAALVWMGRRGLHPERTRMRFDVVVVQPAGGPGEAPQVTWIDDAFRAEWL